jgi:hypothetical protein
MSLPRMGRVDDSVAVFKARQCLPFLKIERTIEESKRSGGCETRGVSRRRQYGYLDGVEVSSRGKDEAPRRRGDLKSQRWWEVFDAGDRRTLSMSRMGRVNDNAAVFKAHSGEEYIKQGPWNVWG